VFVAVALGIVAAGEGRQATSAGCAGQATVSQAALTNAGASRWLRIADFLFIESVPLARDRPAHFPPLMAGRTQLS